MKCFHCHKKIKNELDVEYLYPDFDVIHKSCKPTYERDKEYFFNEVIHDDGKFAKYMGVPAEMIKTKEG